MLDSTRNLLGDIISGKIKDQRLSLIADELTATDRKFSEATFKIGDLESRLQKAESRLRQFETQQPADICPFCRRPTGEIVDLQPDDFCGEAGFKRAYYKCSNPSCAKKYDKRIDP